MRTPLPHSLALIISMSVGISAIDASGNPGILVITIEELRPQLGAHGADDSSRNPCPERGRRKKLQTTIHA